MEDVVQPEALLEDVAPPEAVLLDVVSPESVQMQIEVVLDEIPAVGLALGRPTECDSMKSRSMTDLLGLE